MPRVLHLRNQKEIEARIYDAIKRGDQGDEFNEYMRCAKFIPLALKAVYQDTTDEDWTDQNKPGEVSCESSGDIDRSAKALVHHLEYAIRRSGQRASTIIRQLRALKWLLGHSDADTFGGHRRNPIFVYEYLLSQLQTGDWDRMTGENRKDTTDGTLGIPRRDDTARNKNTEPQPYSRHADEAARPGTDTAPANTKAVA